MAKNKLISILSTCTPEEWKAVRQHILTKTNKTSDVFKLFDTIYQQRENKLENWDTQKVHEKRFTSITRKTFLNMMSTLSLWVDEWLLYKSLNESSIQKNFQLLKSYQERGLYDLANTLASKLKKDIEQLDKKDLSYYKWSKELAHELFYSDNPIKYKDGDELIKNLIEHHIDYTKQLHYLYSIELQNRSKFNQGELSYLLDILNQYVILDPLDDEHILSSLKKMILEYDLKSFNSLSTRLYKDNWEIRSEIHIIVTMYLIIWSSKLWQRGTLKDPIKIVDLYKYGLHTGVLLNQGRLPEKRFHNIVSTIGWLEDNNWTLTFIEEWWTKVDSKIPSNNRLLALAQNAMYRGNYSNITELLRGIKFEAPGQQTRLLGLSLIGWFEERDKYPDQFYNVVTNFKRFLKRTKGKLSSHYHDGHSNLITILESIHKENKEETIEEFLNNSTSLIYRKYATEQLNKMQHD